jgi:putative flippase GtrA
MQLPRQFASFAAIGALATGTHMLCLVLLVESMGWSALPASCVGAAAGAFVSYWLNYHHTFRSTRPHQVALPRFLIVAAVAFVLNGAMMSWLLKAFSLNYLLAQVLTTLTVLTITFSAGRLWAFR